MWPDNDLGNGLSRGSPPACAAVCANGAEILVVANRGPICTPRRRDRGSPAIHSSGGLATTLLSVARRTPLSWISVGAGGAERDDEFHEGTFHPIDLGQGTAIRARVVAVPEHAYRLYYEGISNGVLWFLQHYLLHSDAAPTFDARDVHAWHEGYVAVNRAVADAVVDAIQRLEPAQRRRAVVLLQDYHLYLVAEMIRAALPEMDPEMDPEIALCHFVHIPWPDTRYWQLLPQAFATRILASMLQNHVVGLQTPQDVRNFVACVTDLLPDARQVPTARGAYITWRGRRTLMRAYPVAIDPTHVRALALDPTSGPALGGERRWRAALLPHPLGHQLVLRVDRVEPSKNIVRGVQAFALMLEQHPHLRGRVRFVMLLLPGRNSVARNRAYGRQVARLTREINRRYADGGEPVVIARYGHDRARALAALREYDVLLANSLIEGMHLVAKEGAVLNERDGVLVVSRTAGVYYELSDDACLAITPTDLQETADALFTALTMSPSDRQAMAAAARRRVEARTASDWLNEQVADTFGMVGMARLPRDAGSTRAQKGVPHQGAGSLAKSASARASAPGVRSSTRAARASVPNETPPR